MNNHETYMQKYYSSLAWPVTVLQAQPVSLTGGVTDSGPRASSNHYSLERSLVKLTSGTYAISLSSGLKNFGTPSLLETSPIVT